VVDMPEYSLELAKEFHSAAKSLDCTSEPAARAVIYLSLVSTELAFKVALEQAGCDVKVILRMSHKLPQLLAAVASCEIEWAGGIKSASELRAKLVDPNYADATVGRLLDEPDVSAYPNEIRYGSLLRHFPAPVILECANTVIEWVEQNVGTINYSKESHT